MGGRCARTPTEGAPRSVVERIPTLRPFPRGGRDRADEHADEEGGLTTADRVAADERSRGSAGTRLA